MEDKIKIICVDDEEHTLFGMKALFRKEYEVLLAKNEVEANKLLSEHSDVSVIICDHKMHGKKGTDFLAVIRYTFPDVMRVLFTGSLQTETLFEAINKAWIFKCVQKPLDIEEMRTIILEAHKIYAAKKEIEMLTRQIIGYNEQMKSLLSYYLNKK